MGPSLAIMPNGIQEANQDHTVVQNRGFGKEILGDCNDCDGHVCPLPFLNHDQFSITSR